MTTCTANLLAPLLTEISADKATLTWFILSSDYAEKLCAEAETEKAAEIAKRVAIGQKKEQALRKAWEEAEKAERAYERVVTRDMKAEMARMGLFTYLPIWAISTDSISKTPSLKREMYDCAVGSKTPRKLCGIWGPGAFGGRNLFGAFQR